MAPKRNNMIPNAHFHKDWQRYIKTWFNQPARKVRRHNKRKAKASKVAPRPIGKLRPVVRCPSRKYNTRTKLGKGFTLGELKAAGICKREALNIGVSIDFKRKNRSVESMQKNIQRLKEYKSKLILFPLNKKKIKKNESSLEECGKAQQLKGKIVMPIQKTKTTSYARVITAKEKRFSCFSALQRERRNAKTWGKKAKRAREAAEDAAVVVPKK